MTLPHNEQQSWIVRLVIGEKVTLLSEFPETLDYLKFIKKLF